MTKIEIAELVEGSETPVGEGNNQPVRCLLRLKDGQLIRAVLKRVNLTSVAVECFCSLVLRGWGLHVPQPFLIREPDLTWSFASADEGYPNLKHRLDFDDELPADVRHELRVRAATLVRTFSQTPLAIAADEAIGNRDRHLGNILWDGERVAWIDHEGAFGNSQEPDQNRLVQLICLLPDFVAMQKDTIKAAETLSLAPKLTFDADSKAYFDIETLNTSLETLNTSLVLGLECIAQKVIARFPQPADLLSS